jgi:tripeptidyl-peptidase-1
MRSKDFITCTVTVAQAERIFNVKYFNFQHADGTLFQGTVGPYSVPQPIAQHLDLISGLVGIPEIDVKRGPVVNPSPAPASKDITPVIIRARYNISEDIVCTNSNNSHAVAEFQSQFYSPTDLQDFFKTYVPYAPYEAVAKVVGTNIPTDPTLEASLDIQYITGVAPNATTWFYSYASFNFFNDLLNWTSTLASSVPIPWLHSVSYGTQGGYPTDSVVSRLDTEFQKIGARGVSVLIASGDDGSGCTKGGEEVCGCILYPSYPGSSPYVTAIGATKFLTGNSGPEGAVTAFGSGGGFFVDDSVQAYQAAAVANYFTTAAADNLPLPPSCSYNASNRATPDGAALGDVHFQVYLNGRVVSVGGTSASTPTFSAVVTLLNDIRLNNGENTLGFLNPWIYSTAASNPTAFFDVTVGNNVVADCCANAGGFPCAVGWDPVTGVGTPNFAVLSTLV